MKMVTVIVLLVSLATSRCVKRNAASDQNSTHTEMLAFRAAIPDVSKEAIAKKNTGRNNVFEDAEMILARKEVPILTYHHINNKLTKSEYTVSEERFVAHLKMLTDSGYHTILPYELYAYLTTGAMLPPKPIMITFDDTHSEHYTVAAAAMKRHHHKGVFFIMTISIGKPGYMSNEQIKALSDEGNAIGCHTWDHPNVTGLQEKDWILQVDKPKQQLENLTGKPVQSFAYPFGAWNEAAVKELKKHNITMAFQLTGKRSLTNPLYSIRRSIVPGSWSPNQLHRCIQAAFK